MLSLPASPRHSALRKSLYTVLARSLAVVSILSITSFAALDATAETDSDPIDLALYGRMLEIHTRIVPDLVGTRVDYRSLAKSSEWKRLASQVRAAKPSQLNRAERLAYWINAYNILTIDLIVDHYPVESIRELGSFFSPVWNKTIATIEGRAISLGFIEHEILRKMDEPRIHAAIVCASTSCPPLARAPFRPHELDGDLTRAMRTWLASPGKGIAIDRARRRVRISAIFDWFEEDFEAGGGALPTIARYVSDADAEWLRSEGLNASIRYFDYDWTLNDLE